jgi:hypothetical protein
MLLVRAVYVLKPLQLVLPTPLPQRKIATPPRPKRNSKGRWNTLPPSTPATAKPDKWVVNASIRASMTGCDRPAINTFIEARKQRIDELNAAQGLCPGHNRATARTHPNAIPELVKRFKEEVLGQPF